MINIINSNVINYYNPVYFYMGATNLPRKCWCTKILFHLMVEVLKTFWRLTHEPNETSKQQLHVNASEAHYSTLSIYVVDIYL